MGNHFTRISLPIKLQRIRKLQFKAYITLFFKKKKEVQGMSAMKVVIVVCVAMVLSANCEDGPDCVNLTGNWTCNNHLIGKEDGPYIFSQDGCTGNLDAYGVSFTVSGDLVTFDDFRKMTAKVNPQGTELKFN